MTMLNNGIDFLFLLSVKHLIFVGLYIENGYPLFFLKFTGKTRDYIFKSEISVFKPRITF